VSGASETSEHGGTGLADVGAGRPGRHRAGTAGRRAPAAGATITATPLGDLVSQGERAEGERGSPGARNAEGERGSPGARNAEGERGSPGARNAEGERGEHDGRTERDGLLFTRAVRAYSTHRPGQPLTLLQAGCATAGDDLDVAELRRAGCDIAVSLIDDDNAMARATVTTDPGLMSCTLCDLRVAPLVPRTFDVVHCALLERIGHAELVLDRLVETLKPGGLLLLQTGDRDCAAGFLDRVLPRPLRAPVWRRLRPVAPGPYPAVYERLVSERGIQSYVLRRGLVIAERQEVSLLPDRRRALGLSLACRVLARLSRGRLTAAHDQLRYVIRKPESGFARVL
jgi:SAM-dependent methyltransferase